MRYFVHVRQDWVHEIEGDSPEDAAASFEADPPQHGECTGYGIEAVTTSSDALAEDDLRSPVACRGGCGKQLPPTSNGECIDCLLARLDREQAARSVSGGAR